jgi:uncharacterized protein YejL (UPF0352 family)
MSETQMLAELDTALAAHRQTVSRYEVMLGRIAALIPVWETVPQSQRERLANGVESATLDLTVSAQLVSGLLRTLIALRDAA